MLKFVLQRTCLLRMSCSQWKFSLSPISERKTWKNLNIEIQNFISIFVFRFSFFDIRPLGVFVLKFVLERTCSLRISCSQWRFSLLPIYERKTWKNLNIEMKNFISIFVFRYSPPWRFCAQICTIANVLIANIMFAVEVLTFTHLRKKNLEKFEYRNTEFYFDFRFSIFAPLAFLCSNLYYSERAHCEYHVRSGGSHFHPSTKEKLGKI